MTVEGTAPAAPPELLDERDQLLRSIEDLDRERAAGEVGEPDYERLRAGYVARAAAVLRAIDEAGTSAEPGDDAGAGASGAAAGGPTRSVRRALGRRGVRRGLGVAFAVCVLGLVSLFALRAAGVRLPGETESGGISLNSAEQVRSELQQAQQLGASGDVGGALALYQQILAVQPHQPEALVDRGWLLWLTALETKSKPAAAELVNTARSSIREALVYAPSDGDAHLYLGLTLVEWGGGVRAGAAQFRAAVADHASAALLDAERPVIVQAFRSAREPLPAGLAGSGHSS